MVSVKTLLEYIFDTVLPPRNNERVVREMSVSNIHVKPKTKYFHTVPIISLMEYHDKKIKCLLREVKYEGSKRATELCAEILDEFLLELNIYNLDCPKNIVLIPIPLSKKREKERGYNQSEIIIRALCKKSHYSLCNNILFRNKETLPQTTLRREQRIENVANAFSIHTDKPKLTEKIKKYPIIILLDDVTTTGATMFNAHKALMHAGIKSIPIAISRA